MNLTSFEMQNVYFFIIILIVYLLFIYLICSLLNS